MSIFSKYFRRFSSPRGFTRTVERGVATFGRTRKATPRFTAGFTLIELLVVSIIILVITTVILLRQDKFNSSTLLRSLGYNIALSVRQAQVYGTSVFGVESQGAIVHAPAYGVSFSRDVKTNYVLFAALTPGDYSYATALTNKVKLFTLGSGYQIVKFCATPVADLTVQYCSTDATLPLQYLSIYFKRPNPDAFFATDRTGEQYAGALVQVQSQNGDTRGITVTASGQISVVAPNTTPPAPPAQ